MSTKPGKHVRPHSHGNDAALVERRVKAFELRKQGQSFRAIAKVLGVSYTTVQNDVQKCLDEYLVPQVDSYRRQMLAETDDQLIRLYAKLEKPQYIVTAKGEYALDPDGKPMINEEYQLKVEDRISRQLEIRAKLLGVFAPQQTEVTVTEVTQQDLAVMDLVARQKAKTALAKQEFKANQTPSA